MLRLTICSFLKEIDDVDVIDVATWSWRDVQRLTARSTFRMSLNLEELREVSRRCKVPRLKSTQQGQ